MTSVLMLAGAALLVAHAQPAHWQQLRVSASAYNAVARQTTRSESAIAAWGDKLKPGMHAIAVSRDLIRKGLTHGTRVKIEGLSGIYIVRDKMSRRFRRKIDIYMGKDVAAAREWGVQKDIRISFAEPAQ